MVVFIAVYSSPNVVLQTKMFSLFSDLLKRLKGLSRMNKNSFATAVVVGA